MTYAYVTDRARAVGFYTETLGFTVRNSSEHGDTIDMGRSLLHLTPMADHKAGPHPVVGWEVPDVVAVVGTLKARGVAMTVYEGMGQDALGGMELARRRDETGVVSRPGRECADAVAALRGHRGVSAKNNAKEPVVLTIGHSTRPIDEFVRMLRAHGVQRLADVRTVPGSRHNPQFGGDALKATLENEGIEYIHMKTLGGLRKPLPDSINAAWKNTSFRGYANYMQTADFDAAVSHFIELAQEKQTVIMCAEAVPWRCHRSLVADALTAREIPVEHIMSESRRDKHKLTSFAKRAGVRVTYPPEETQPELLRMAESC